MKRALFSQKKDSSDRSKKACVCGGHSMRDRKKNCIHAGTKAKITRRAIRKHKSKVAGPDASGPDDWCPDGWMS